jgi:hypothetical protein
MADSMEVVSPIALFDHRSPHHRLVLCRGVGQHRDLDTAGRECISLWAIFSLCIFEPAVKNEELGKGRTKDAQRGFHVISPTSKHRGWRRCWLAGGADQPGGVRAEMYSGFCRCYRG